MIGIIGTAGRNDDAFKLSARSFIKMGEFVHDIVTNRLQIQWNDVDLISGGAAWADHLAVHHFLRGCGKSLTLALPCSWDFTNRRFADTGSYDWRTNPGATANKHHLSFSTRCGFRSLDELHEALSRPNCTFDIGSGFHDRNTYIAERCDALIAFTFGNGAILKDGGTADTMGKFLKLHGSVGAFHVDLNSWTVHDQPVVKA